jgi:hypothetical protein
MRRPTPEAALREVIAALGCRTLYAGRPKETCVTEMQNAKAGRGRLEKNWRARVASGSELCERCHLRVMAQRALGMRVR